MKAGVAGKKEGGQPGKSLGGEEVWSWGKVNETQEMLSSQF